MLHGMGLIQLYSTPKTNMAATDTKQTARCLDENATFCRCHQMPRKQRSRCQTNSSAGQLSDKSRKVSSEPAKESYIQPVLPPDTCRCGEDTCQNIDWTWDRQNVTPATMFRDSNTVQFHPIYSQGTTVVRSDQKLASNMIHYWEIKIVHWLSGTDLVSSGLFYIDLVHC